MNFHIKYKEIEKNIHSYVLKDEFDLKFSFQLIFLIKQYTYLGTDILVYQFPCKGKKCPQLVYMYILKIYFYIDVCLLKLN